jgi:prepilin-type N-terminal cleavage/methylation domain-containing protein
VEVELMKRHDTTTPARRQDSAGFSIIEVLVAAVILAVIALGLIPLYTRSIRSNVEGFDYTQVSNFAKSRAEEYKQLPFGSPLLTVPAGNEELEVEDFYSAANDEWVDTVDQLAEGEKPLFIRTTTVRQFQASALETPLDGNLSAQATLKEITVTVEGTRPAGSPMGPGKSIDIRVMKAI